MIHKPKYRTRTVKDLRRFVKDCQNALQMRDWQIDLIYGDTIPKEFVEGDDGNPAYIKYEHGHLTASIWVSPIRCARDNTDPRFNVAHEIAHAFQDSHSEEVRSCT